MTQQIAQSGTDWKLVVALIGLLISLVGLVISLYFNLKSYRRAQREAKLGLKVEVNSTRDHCGRQMCQFRLYNDGKRPANVVGWMVQYGEPNPSLYGTAENDMPFLLKEQEARDFTVVVDEHPVEQIVALGVETKDRQFVYATPENLKRFIATAVAVREKRF